MLKRSQEQEPEAGPPELDPEAAQLAAIGNFAGLIAHDFNNIFTGILGNLELLQRRAAKLNTGAFDEYLKGASNAATRGVEFNRKLIAIAGHQQLDPKTLQLDTVIAGLAGKMRAITGRNITITINHKPGLWPVLCDAAKFEETILELAANARDAMPDGGTLTISLENIPNMACPNGLKGDFAVIKLRDSGSGIPPEITARVFEPFVSTKGYGKGLGLAMALGFMRQSGGDLRLTAAATGGTTVQIYLPRA